MKTAIAATLAVACLAAQAAPKVPTYYDQNGKLFGAAEPNQGLTMALFRFKGTAIEVPIIADVHAGGMVPSNLNYVYYTSTDCTGAAYFTTGFLSGGRSSAWLPNANGLFLVVADSMKVVDGPITMQSSIFDGVCGSDAEHLSNMFISTTPPINMSNFVFPLVLR